MNDDADFLWRPILEGIFSGESLINGTIDLMDIAEAHDALDVRSENERRAQAAMQRRR
jgi:hypothetical protein